MHPLQKLNHFLRVESESRSVSFFRIAVGVAVAGHAFDLRRLMLGSLRPGTLQLPLIDWLPLLSQDGVLVFFWTLLFFSLLFTFGIRANFAAFASMCLLTYGLFFSQQTYSNHYYLLILIIG